LKKLNVLSLFDGMSCGRIALKKAKIPINNYFASEIDLNAIKVSSHNFKKIQQIGTVTKIESTLLPGIDLLIGGSPCQSFSFAGKRNGMSTTCDIEVTSLEQYLELKNEEFEFKGQSYLFWEYVRILKEVKPKYFLLENVLMSSKWADIISEVLGVQPIMINSSILSGQVRKRLYWTNIPNVTMPKTKDIVFNDIKCNQYHESLVIDRKYKATLKPDTDMKQNKSYRLGGYMKQGQGQRVYYINGKSVCLSALGGGWGAKTGLYLESNGDVRKPTQRELERLQTVPEGYTDCLTYTQACKVIGNGWTVDVIKHIFKHLKKRNLFINDIKN
jgi:site-specific DNA-cytosine methylase